MVQEVGGRADKKNAAAPGEGAAAGGPTSYCIGRKANSLAMNAWV